LHRIVPGHAIRRRFRTDGRGVVQSVACLSLVRRAMTP
jgi:hypothetical protein